MTMQKKVLKPPYRDTGMERGYRQNGPAAGPDRCPKCGSRSVYLDYDQYGWFQSCLQCGNQGRPA